MREYTEPTPIDLQAFSTGRVLKESWEISTKYFGALVMPMFIVMLPVVGVSFLVPGKGGEAMNNFLSVFLTPFAVMGLHRSMLLLKAQGLTPRFGQTFAHGSDYWWRGIKIGIVSGLYCIPLILVIVVLIMPGAILIEKMEALGGFLLVLGVGLSLTLLAWFCGRACLVYAAMADDRTSSTKAFDAGWQITKGKLRHTLSLGFSILGIGLLTVLALVIVGAAAVGLELCRTEVAVGLLAIPAVLAYIFVLTYAHVATNLAYQALKPAELQATIP
jgi:hypothetical protein